jgi:hypothetical protein
MITTIALVAIAIAQLIQVGINLVAVLDVRRSRADQAAQIERMLAEQTQTRESMERKDEMLVAVAREVLPPQRGGRLQ